MGGEKKYTSPRRGFRGEFQKQLKMFSHSQTNQRVSVPDHQLPKGLLRSGRGLVTPLNMVFYFNQDRTMKNPWRLTKALGKWFLLQQIGNLRESLPAPGEAALR